MNYSYECLDCQAQFSSPKRGTCVICDSPQLDEIPPLAPLWECAELGMVTNSFDTERTRHL